VRCPYPWPRPTTTRSRRRCGSSGDGVRSAAPPSGSRLLHKPARRSLRRAVWRAPRACPQPLCSWRASESGQRDSTAHSTARSSAMAACSPERALPTARPPWCCTSKAHRCRCPMPLSHAAPLTAWPASHPQVLKRSLLSDESRRFCPCLAGGACVSS